MYLPIRKSINRIQSVVDNFAIKVFKIIVITHSELGLRLRSLSKVGRNNILIEYLPRE